MPRKSQRKSSRRKGSRRQIGGNNGEGASQAAVPTQAPAISQETLQQAGKMAQQLLNNAMSPQGGNSGQVGGSSGGALPDGAGGAAAGGAAAPGAAAGAAAPGAAGAAAAPTPGLQAAMTAGAVGGAVAGAEAYSSLHGSPIMGGGRRRRRSGRGSKTTTREEKNGQQGGMVPGLMTAVETALVPLGLYIGQKALQSRRSSGRSSSLGSSFRFRRDSSRTRRRR